MSVVLQVDGLAAGYGRVPVLRDVSLKVQQGEFVALLGANGAGKTTLLRAVVGLCRVDAGVVMLNGTDVTHARTEALARRGVGLVPEGRQLFGSMNVIDHLLLGAHAIRRRRAEVDERVDRMLTLFPHLAARRRQRAHSMSGGEQQMLALARCLMGEPQIVLLDEPSLGLASKVVESVFDAIDALRGTGTTFTVVEQNALMTLQRADRAYVFEHGRMVLTGTAAEIAASPLIREAYLALDHRDWQLLEDCFAPDGGVDYGDLGGELQGASKIAAFCRQALEGLDASQHLIGNTMIELDGDRANSTCYFQAQHVFAGASGGDTYIVAGTYADVLTRHDGGWRIVHRTLTPSWTQGNPEVFTAAAARIATR